MRGAVLGPCCGAAVRSPDGQRGLDGTGTAGGVGEMSVRLSGLVSKGLQDEG